MHILSNRTSSCYNGYNTVIIIIVADSRGIHVRAVTRTRPPRHPPQTEGKKVTAGTIAAPGHHTPPTVGQPSQTGNAVAFPAVFYC